MESFAYFPAVVYREEQPDLAEHVLPHCLDVLKDFRTEDQYVHQSRHLSGDFAFQGLVKYLLKSSVGILSSQGYDVSKYEFELSGLWAQEIQPTGRMDAHVHKNSQVCGWIFLETPDNGSYPVYIDCRLNKSMVELDYPPSEEITNATGEIHFNNVIPGTVLFSNSWLQHKLTQNNSNLPTRCVHFIVSHKERTCNTY